MVYELEEDPSPDSGVSPDSESVRIDPTSPGFKVGVDILKGSAHLRDYFLDMDPIAKTNITNMGEFLWGAMGSNPGSDDDLLWVQSTTEKLAWWDSKYNGSVLIGKSTNSVYSFYTITDKTDTFYPIGGDGGPNIMINLGSNWDTDTPFKCESISPMRSGKYLYFEIISSDGEHFCMPGWVAAYNEAIILSQHPYRLSVGTFVGDLYLHDYEDTLGEASDPHNWNGYLYGQIKDDAMAMGGGFSPDDASTSVNALMRTRQRAANMSNPGTGQLAAHAEYGEESLTWYGGLIPHYWDRLRLKGEASGWTGSWLNGWSKFVKIAVPWTANDIRGLEFQWAGAGPVSEWSGVNESSVDGALPTILESAANATSLKTAMRQDELTYSYYESFDTVTKLREFSLTNFVTRFEESSPPKEDEYETIYSQLERDGLITKFGSISNTSTMLNARFMHMAHYLATTYIQSVYTFKTVKMPPLTAEMITPPNLSSHDGSVTISAYNPTSQVYSAGMYYPATGYSTPAGITSPTEVTWATYELLTSIGAASLTDFMGEGVTSDWNSYVHMMHARSTSGGQFYGSGVEDTTIESGRGLYEGDESGTLTDPAPGGGYSGGGVDY